jgi:hypothetical protein
MKKKRGRMMNPKKDRVLHSNQNILNPNRLCIRGLTKFLKDAWLDLYVEVGQLVVVAWLYNNSLLMF